MLGAPNSIKMNLSQFLSGWGDHKSKVESMSAEIGELKQLLSAEATGKTELATEVETLRAQLAKKDTDLSAANAKVVELEGKVTALGASVASEKQRADGAEAAASIKLGAELGAKTGVPIGSAPASEASKDKPDFKALRGLDKVVAIEKYEAAQRGIKPQSN
jgi:regulator of replication initiation timing